MHVVLDIPFCFAINRRGFSITMFMMHLSALLVLCGGSSWGVMADLDRGVCLFVWSGGCALTFEFIVPEFFTIVNH